MHAVPVEDALGHGMFLRRWTETDHVAYTGLPARRIHVCEAHSHLAVHVAGDLAKSATPVVCVPGYVRNMLDYEAFTQLLAAMLSADWPVVLVDLQGRGRASRRRRHADYASPRDAFDLAAMLAALAIGPAIFIGQGYGGQVTMVLAAHKPTLISGTILVDAGPVGDTRGIVRLRNNLKYINGLRGAEAVTGGYRRMLGGDYPGASAQKLDRLSHRAHGFTRRGRPVPLFDPRLIKNLAGIGLDDVLTAQWPLFDALAHAPLLLMRTQLTDQLRRETFEQMAQRRPDAKAITLAGQGYPALLDDPADVAPIIDFIRRVDADRRR